jgi:asparagine synthase (glutamine-hydrolysing)
MIALEALTRVNGLTEMTQHSVGDDRQNRYLRRHGSCGSYSASSHVVPPENHMHKLQEALNTTLPQVCKAEATFAATTTGIIHTIKTGGVAILFGSPWFPDKKLADLAKVEGQAAALVHAYEEHSQDVFKQLRGLFGCVIIDTRLERVLLAIDRTGQQTLYYFADDRTLAFGSSAGSVLASADREISLINQGIYNYVYFHMVPSPLSVYREIYKLPAAHFLDYRNGKAQLVNYWCPTFYESTSQRPLSALSTQLKGVLRSSVEHCLADSGKTGAFLSGGLDSSTVAGLLAESGAENTAAYSIGFAAEGYDEMAYARITAKHFNLKLHEYYVTPQDVVDALPLIATSYDEPFGNSSALPAYFCAKMAADNGVDTLLAGDGGDELFGGNERYVKQRVFEYYGTLPAYLRRGLIEPVLRLLPSALPLVPKAKSYISQANLPLPDRLQSYNFLHRHAAAEIFSDDFLEDVDVDLPLDLLQSIYHRPENASTLNRMLYLDWQITLADNDLRKVSQMCALAGVDVAYPMLNDELVDFSCQVPSIWKIKGRDLRHFYKQALTGWLPRETINKTKQGFGLPFGVWMKTYAPLREMAYDNLLKLKARQFIRPEFIDKAIAMHQSEHAAYYGELVWILTVFELWLAGNKAYRAI